MSHRIRDANASVNSSRLPLEVSLPLAVSVIIFLTMAAVLLHRSYRRKRTKSRQLGNSPSLLILSDPEANRQWLEDLSRLKELGLRRLRSAKRTYSLCSEAKCRELGNSHDDASLIGLPTRPRNAFLPTGRSRSASTRAVVRQSWIQNVFHSGYQRLLGSRTNRPSHGQVIPEIRITVPSMVADEATSILPQDRRWSTIIARDISVASDCVSSQSFVARQTSAAWLTKKVNSASRPPNSMDTLPFPARRRLSCASISGSGIIQSRDLHSLQRTLSPIKETKESLSSYSTFTSETITETGLARKDETTARSQLPDGNCSLMSSYGLALLHSSSSLYSDSSGPVNDAPVDLNLHDVSDVDIGSSKQLSTMGYETTSSASPLCFEQASLPGFSASEHCDCEQIVEYDVPTESPVTPSPRTSRSHCLFACNPDLCPMPRASAPIHAEQACSSLPTPFIPSIFTDEPLMVMSPVLMESLVSDPCLKSSEAERKEGCDHSDKMTGGESSSGLSGVELWVDDDVDLFYFPGPDEVRERSKTG